MDGQDNPLPASRMTRFHEVTTQFVLTSHLVGLDLISISARVWDRLHPGAAGRISKRRWTRAIDFNAAKHIPSRNRRCWPSSAARGWR